MFSFLKRHKSQDVFEISQPEAVIERALRVFSKIEGLDDIKEMMLRALESSERAHTLLTGPPASSKSLFMLQIEKFIQSKVYFAEGAAHNTRMVQSD
jgi:Holliday junction DNA helicase RuvB